MDRLNGIVTELLVQAYKKLKSSVFFDKTQLVLRNKLVRYEASPNFDEKFIDLGNKIIQGEYDEIIESISCLTLPKSIKRVDKDNFISNLENEKVCVDEMQYFIDMNVEGYILGIFWLMLVGTPMDGMVYEHSYGNRMRTNLLDKYGFPTRSPYLFQPYFNQYESWRDTALSYAQKSLGKNQDVVVLMLDFKRFFYQVGLSEDEFWEIVDECVSESPNNCHDNYRRLAYSLTDFVWAVIEKYSSVLRQKCYDLVEERVVLPIGFHPSNVLANIALKKFDETLINGWNPIYYGRYVDDIIIVEKIEKNSEIYKKAQQGTLKSDNVIEHYLTFCNAWQKGKSKCKKNAEQGLLVKLNEQESQKYFGENSDDVVYKVNPKFNQFKNSEIIVQKNKVKIFYFDSSKSDALLRCFKEQIIKNKSEFRFLPEDEAVFQSSDYTEIYHLTNNDGPNKLRGVDGLSIDKYNLSKFLGKYLRISGLINDNLENKFECDIDKIFTPSVIIENYQMWEKVLEILIINEKYDTYYKFVKQIVRAIDNVEFPENKGHSIVGPEYDLVSILCSAVLRTLALVWGPEVKVLAQSIYEVVENTFIFVDYSDVDDFNNTRKMYCITRMCDKYTMPILIDCVLNDVTLFEDKFSFNLCDFDSVTQVIKSYELEYDNAYDFYPYLVTMFDLNFNNQMKELTDCSYEINTTNASRLKEEYIKINYHRLLCGDDSIQSVLEIKSFDNKKSDFAIKVGDEKKTKVKIAVANTSLYESNVEAVLSGNPKRDFSRYQNLVRVVNEAIKEKADFLVLPENYLPFEWIPILTRTCAKNQLAIVTGIEHVKMQRGSQNKEHVANLTAVILPYMEDSYKFAYVHFHKKVNMSPNELEKIRSYRCEPHEGTSYELYNWNDFWFSVYCCYELTSIKDRSLFQSHIDALIAVEWNKDVNYYSNIVESLSRDLHCFCVQVNDSRYGDSRITMPSKTESKDKLKVKGGKNTSLLVDDIDFSELRRFQYKGVLLQSKDYNPNSFKQTPPDFDYGIVGDKINGKLWERINNGQNDRSSCSFNMGQG